MGAFRTSCQTWMPSRGNTSPRLIRCFDHEATERSVRDLVTGGSWSWFYEVKVA